MNNILNMLFTLMQIAISSGLQAELSTIASRKNPTPNLCVVINGLNSFNVEPREYDHVRVRVCHSANKFRFLVEEILLDGFESKTTVDLSKFWDNCPYGEYDARFDLFAVDYEDADDLLKWVIKRGEDIKPTGAYSWSVQ